MFEWIESFYNPRRKHTSLDNLSPVDCEPFTPPQKSRHDQHTRIVRETGAGSGRAKGI